MTLIFNNPVLELGVDNRWLLPSDEHEAKATTGNGRDLSTSFQEPAEILRWLVRPDILQECARGHLGNFAAGVLEGFECPTNLS